MTKELEKELIKKNIEIYKEAMKDSIGHTVTSSENAVWIISNAVAHTLRMLKERKMLKKEE